MFEHLHIITVILMADYDNNNNDNDIIKVVAMAGKVTLLYNCEPSCLLLSLCHDGWCWCVP